METSSIQFCWEHETKKSGESADFPDFLSIKIKKQKQNNFYFPTLLLINSLRLQPKPIQIG